MINDKFIDSTLSYTHERAFLFSGCDLKKVHSFRKVYFENHVSFEKYHLFMFRPLRISYDI